MNIFKVDFQELYERHLCRHSQPGINVAHLGSVAVTYFGAFLLISHLLSWHGSPAWLWWLLPAALVPYFAVLARNLPARLVGVTVLAFALLLLAVYWVPPLPTWLALPLSAALIALGHKSQAWSHRVWTKELDMTDFNKKYQKGLMLFLLLAVYELPILLNYLVFAGRGAAVAPPPDPQAHLASAGLRGAPTADQASGSA
jgi:hypothetical protein